MTCHLQFSTRITAEGRRACVEVAGEVDLDTGSDLLQAVRAALDPLADGSPPEQVVIDLGRVTFMDSSGLLAVLRCREVVETGGAALRIVVPGGPVARLFEVAGVTGWIDHS